MLALSVFALAALVRGTLALDGLFLCDCEFEGGEKFSEVDYYNDYLLAAGNPPDDVAPLSNGTFAQWEQDCSGQEPCAHFADLDVDVCWSIIPPVSNVIGAIVGNGSSSVGVPVVCVAAGELLLYESQNDNGSYACHVKYLCLNSS